MRKAEKLFKDRKSSFRKFVDKNQALKTLGRNYIDGNIVELYNFFLSGKDPEWDERMRTLKIK